MDRVELPFPHRQRLDSSRAQVLKGTKVCGDSDAAGVSNVCPSSSRETRIVPSMLSTDGFRNLPLRLSLMIRRMVRRQPFSALSPGMIKEEYPGSSDP
ncbi:hypothetical protein M413DRAFT_266249 [Hebeloma cylindrosporum]|uniref:Uncharacterized protein n=1 Tax=Hebeloma cylindrosporum TaxID=76867 RepID=A0A0C2Z187_HEBCY|nr:hypothetical protein M413DRAFT_266249 [Hebeloma cylindrosporum h7]